MPNCLIEKPNKNSVYFSFFLSFLKPYFYRSNDPSHHERTLLPRSYISLANIWRKEGNVLFNDALNIFLLTVIWRQAYG